MSFFVDIDKRLGKIVEEWKLGGAPYLSPNDAVVVWFVTGDKPTNLPEGPPHIVFKRLSESERKFIENYQKKTVHQRVI